VHPDPDRPKRRVDPRDIGSCVEYETGDASLPRVVVLRDSFSEYLGGFLAPHFERVAMYIDALDPRNERPGTEPRTILDEAPDLVIEEISETLLRVEPPARPW